MLNRTRASRRATGGGLVGSAVTLLCCAGVAPVIGVVSAIGLGFLLRDAILIPLLILGVGVTIWGLWQGRRCHGRGGPLVVGLLGGLITVGGVPAWVPLALAGFVAVIVASIWNLQAVRACLARRSMPG
ncbi:MAG: MerC domain-containing protein [Gemmatimonadetes bacterium]|nr:MerC domain-containing protein [Gemmatimonadota bacterium]